MALRASDRCVTASERKLGVVVIEVGRRPGRSGVADVAVLRESAGHMVWILRSLKVFRVATVAVHTEPSEDAAGVALGAGGTDVCAGERKLGLRGVIERGSRPIGGGVAERAILRESRRGVVRIGRALVILQVTGVASHSETFVDAARVAL